MAREIFAESLHVNENGVDLDQIKNRLKKLDSALIVKDEFIRRIMPLKLDHRINQVSDLPLYLGQGPGSSSQSTDDQQDLSPILFKEEDCKKIIRFLSGCKNKNINQYICLGKALEDFGNYFGLKEFGDRIAVKYPWDQVDDKAILEYDGVILKSKFENNIYTVQIKDKKAKYFDSDYEFKALNLKVKDNTPARLSAIGIIELYSFIANFLSSGQGLLIHCRGGFGRTGNIFLAIMIFLHVTSPEFMSRHFEGLPELGHPDYYFLLLDYIRAFRGGLVVSFEQFQDAIGLSQNLINKFFADHIPRHTIDEMRNQLNKLVMGIKDNGVQIEWNYHEPGKFIFSSPDETIRKRVDEAFKYYSKCKLKKNIHHEIRGRSINVMELIKLPSPQSCELQNLHLNRSSYWHSSKKILFSSHPYDEPDYCQISPQLY